MIDKTLRYVMDGAAFKSLTSSRTDAMVSANESAFELFTFEEINNLDEFLIWFNHNLPQDIRVLSIKPVDEKFNIIQNSKIKEYHYVFSEGQKNHPFCAPILTTILEPLDIEIMKQGAKLFQGTHYLKSYCYKPTDHGEYNRTILESTITENTVYKANFFPKTSYIFKVKGKGFMRNQIRLMMGVLIKLGRGEVDLTFIENSLKPDFDCKIDYIAPASGLILNHVNFDGLD
ncbi:tRNA pseudouridine(38-40) synthase TruA [Paucihalobacter ruber]|uniref:tRNA pseudouridine synthase n=2 Tax=Paucihalobacter ruber TaxID=2567861 RepID=A0A506PDK9_9FLAO|nr:tRNA pseudouridine(38-40) synthase TruA [Paucihalobacter ruber]TPV31495.1 tRNA pseudouridine(38-40) synthase TruA [Paucihalobacter ruber]